MAEYKPTPEEEKILKAMERFTGRKFPKVTEEQMSASVNSLNEWDKAGRPYTEPEASDTDTLLYN